MLFDTITLAEGAEFANLTVATGTAFPSNPTAGELFYRTDLSLLHVYSGSDWTEVGAGTGGGGGGSTVISATGDSYFNQTSLLLNFAGTNATQRTFDSSIRQNTLTFGANASISSTQSKFGGTSAYFTGTSPGYISTSVNVTANSGLDLSTQAPDWTIEAWAYPTAVPSATNEFNGIVVGWGGGYGAGYSAASIALGNNGVWRGQWNSTNAAGTDMTIGGGAAALNSWTHLALSKSISGGTQTIRFFVNGALMGSSTTNTNIYFPTAAWRVGSGVNDTYRFIGYVDGVRVTKGVGRYTAAFTAPTAAFPEFQAIA